MCVSVYTNSAHILPQCTFHILYISSRKLSFYICAGFFGHRQY